MFILKRFSGSGVVFDTQNPSFYMPQHEGSLPGPSLHQHIDETVYIFLRRYFKPDHQIFKNFGQSFYYVA